MEGKAAQSTDSTALDSSLPLGKSTIIFRDQGWYWAYLISVVYSVAVYIWAWHLDSAYSQQREILQNN